MILATSLTLHSLAPLRLSYLSLSSISRGFKTSTSRPSSGNYDRADFTSGFTSTYEPGLPTAGPLGGASNLGAPRLTPKALKQHLDQFVVGQERAKRVLSVAVYNHYKRIQELERLEHDEEERLQQQARRTMGHRHPVEGSHGTADMLLDGADSSRSDEFPGQQRTTHDWDNSYPAEPPSPPQPPPTTHSRLGDMPIVDESPMTIEKSNILLFGPSGVGKTLMAKTLARVLAVPFSMSDCTPFTQAGYIGEDADVCVQRLLAAANYDVEAAERGIIVLDEIDKIATARVSHGKDVSGEGVQQALLKIIEGTTLQIQAKPERGAASGPKSPGGHSGYTYSPPGGSSGGAAGGMNIGQPPPRNEVFNVRTDNILFICAGAFNGLHKIVLDRIDKGSIGFGASVRASNPETGASDTIIKGDESLYRKHVPFYMADPPPTASSSPSSKPGINTLDLVEPSDLQKYGIIPELVGRIPVSCALSALDEEALVRVLTEPRNSLVKQYEQLLSLSGIELRFTSPALREIARAASKMGTGARGLRTVMERLLGEAMFECPGSTTKHILLTRDAALRKTKPVYVSRGQQPRFQAMWEKEEEEWRRELAGDKEGEPQSIRDFQEYRQRSATAGGAA
ncbi:P-loop containing nucleoside triphosphate hydrolase protein [Phyllosticta capitalensis]|uniref:P-loop containing nucleoside triphosphate hydrolase protein n=1 Tax=Phyllosticta capitalensis TaxID=121624 RepID=UPI003130A40F